jgi:hypothetical protein
MNYQVKITISIFFLICLFASIGQCGLVEHRVILVDKIGDNYLFRTNNPNNGDVFDYDNLVRLIRQKIIDSGDSFPAEFIFEIWNLMNFT